MGVEVVWKDAAGAELDRASDGPGWFARSVGQAQDARRGDAPILTSIDLYGDTIILPPRTETLAAEVAKVRAETTEVEARIHLGKVIMLARAASAQPDSFLVCLGD